MTARSLFDDEATDSAARGKARREHYAGVAAEQLLGAPDCQFCLLPYQELARSAGVWYEAATEAMMRANYRSEERRVGKECRL